MREETYSVSLTGMIAQALQGYTGHEAIISELLQNADDAQASKVSIDFQPQHLEVRNDSYFRQKDWDNIQVIASHGKREEENKIGTFGTGFVSVFHITDKPRILSNGDDKEFDPLKAKININECEIGEETIFRFPWRKEASELSQQINSEMWDESRISEFMESAKTFIPKALIFLRNVKEIQILNQNNELLVVRKSLEDNKSSTHFSREIWNIEQTDHATTTNHTWLYYHTQNQEELASDISIKDRKVTIALPIGQKIQGILYNFLPTQITTECPFHINGAFFPDNNRHGILDDSNTKKLETQWNHSVIEIVANLFSDSLIDIRDYLESNGYTPTLFYKLWITNPLPPKHNLQIIHRTFVEKAQNEKIVYSSRGQWKKPSDIWLTTNENIYSLAQEHFHVLPMDVLSFQKQISQLGGKKLTVRTLIEQIQNRLQNGLPFKDAPEMINSEAKLTMLYSELPARNEPDFDWIRQQFIFLSANSRLYRATDLYDANEDTRTLFYSDNHPLFADSSIKKALNQHYIQQFKGRHLIDWLWNHHRDQPYFENEQHLADILKFTQLDLNQVDVSQLTELSIVLSHQNKLHRGHEVFYAANKKAYDLGLDQLLLLDQDFANDRNIREVYEKAGLKQLTPSIVIHHLENYVDSTHVDDMTFFQRIYNYLGESHLSDENIRILRRIPIFVTAGGQRVALQDIPDLSSQPDVPSRNREKIQEIVDKLQLDNYIHPELKNEIRFLQKMGIQPLNENRFTHHLVKQYYHSEHINDQDRLVLLNYVKEIYDYADTSAKEAINSANLILCNNNQYYSAPQIYFASALLDEIFDGNYIHPHTTYEFSSTQIGDENRFPYKDSKWYVLFSNMGMLEDPKSEDVIARIRKLTDGKVTAAKAEAVQRIAQYIENLPHKELENYAGLRDIAWLPRNTFNNAWHQPSEIYRIEHKKLLSENEPTIRFRLKKSFADFLNIPQRPESNLVSRHLLEQSKNNKSIDGGEIYKYLGEYWDELSFEYMQRLQSEAIIWDKDKHCYWKASQCFLGTTLHKYFGHLRFYLQETDGYIADFFRYVGIHEHATSEQHIDLLNELRQDQPLTGDYRTLLLNNFTLFGENIDHFQEVIRRCKLMQIVPDQHGNLHSPDAIIYADQPRLKQKLQSVTLPYVSEDFTTEQILVFLDAINIVKLSYAKPEIVHTGKTTSNHELKRQILERHHHILRIVFHESEKTELSYDLTKLKILTCQKLDVTYQILNKQSDVISEDAVFVREHDQLYIARDIVKRNATERIASALIEILRLENIVSPIAIDVILSKPVDDLSTYLDNTDCKPLPMEVQDIPLHTPITLNKIQSNNQQSEWDEDDVIEEQFADEEDELDKFDEGITLDHSDSVWEDSPEDYQYNAPTEHGHVSGSTMPYRPSFSSTPHYPNILSEIISQFSNIKQEEPPEPIIKPIARQLEMTEFKEIVANFDISFDIDTTWSDILDEDPNDDLAGFESAFAGETPNMVFSDLQDIVFSLPDPEDRRGVFQLICEAFIRNGSDELLLDEIKNSVWARRPRIALGTISSILSRAFPCFIKQGGAIWLIQPQYIEAGYWNLNNSIGRYIGWANSWSSNNASQNGYINQSTKRTQSHRSSNRNPSKPNRLPRHKDVHDTFNDIDSGNQLLDLETYLDYVPQGLLGDQYSIIQLTAENKEQNHEYKTSLRLYKILKQHGFKDNIDNKIHDLETLTPFDRIQRIAESIEPHDPALWDKISQERYVLNQSELSTLVEQYLPKAISYYQEQAKQRLFDDTLVVSEIYIEWLRHLYPISDHWRYYQVEVIEKIAPIVFDLLLRTENEDLVAQLFANIPTSSKSLFEDNSDTIYGYLWAVEEIYRWYIEHNHVRKGNIILSYGLFIAKQIVKKVETPYSSKLQDFQLTEEDYDIVRSDPDLRRWINLEILKQAIRDDI